MGPMAVLDDYHSVAVGGRAPSALNVAHVLGSPVNRCTDTRVARVGIIASSQCIHQASVIRPIRSPPALAACTGDDLNSLREILKYRPYLLWVPLIPLPFSQSHSSLRLVTMPARHFCCCLPLRLGAFLISFCQLAFCGLIAAGGWYTVSTMRA